MPEGVPATPRGHRARAAGAALGLGLGRGAMLTPGLMASGRHSGCAGGPRRRSWTHSRDAPWGLGDRRMAALLAETQT